MTKKNRFSHSSQNKQKYFLSRQSFTTITWRGWVRLFISKVTVHSVKFLLTVTRNSWVLKIFVLPCICIFISPSDFNVRIQHNEAVTQRSIFQNRFGHFNDDFSNFLIEEHWDEDSHFQQKMIKKHQWRCWSSMSSCL